MRMLFPLWRFWVFHLFAQSVKKVPNVRLRIFLSMIVKCGIKDRNGLSLQVYITLIEVLSGHIKNISLTRVDQDIEVIFRGYLTWSVSGISYVRNNRFKLLPRQLWPRTELINTSNRIKIKVSVVRSERSKCKYLASNLFSFQHFIFV